MHGAAGEGLVDISPRSFSRSCVICYLNLIMIVAVVLSAGESSRMGRPKALLPLDGQTFIERIIRALKETKVDKIIVVLGHHLEEIRREIADLSVEILVNSDYKRGQLSSLQAAIRRIEPDGADAMLVHLVDIPFVNPGLVDRMIELLRTSGKLIVAPCYRGRRGHPVLFSKALFSELLSLPLDRAAKEVVHAHRDETLEVETEDEGVLRDIDTPEEYQRYLRDN